MTKGFWGPITSHRDWCEENYAVSIYIAEFWNTISNISYFLAVLHIFYYKYKYSKYLSWNYTIFISTVFVVAICSVTFHGTLLFWPQQIDRAIDLFIFVTAYHSMREITSAQSQTIAVLITLAHCIFSIFWLVFDYFYLFEVYLAGMAILALYKAYIISKQLQIKERALKAHVFKAFCILLLFFAINVTDGLLCALIKNEIYFPYMHVIWHIGSAIGIHQLCFIVMYAQLFAHNLKPRFKDIKCIALAIGISIEVGVKDAALDIDVNGGSVRNETIKSSKTDTCIDIKYVDEGKENGKIQNVN